MRILILHFLSENDKNTKILRNLESSATKNSHEVSIVDGTKDVSSVHLSIYDYIAVLISSGSIRSSKPPQILDEILKNQGTVSGKKSCALVVKSGFSSGKTCKYLMDMMESNGMFLDYFDIIESIDHATATGKKLG